MIFGVVKDFMEGIIGAVGYPGVFFAMVIESCLIPLPSEVTMTLAGSLASSGQMNVHIAAMMGGLGNVVGSLIAYWLGTVIPEPTLVRFIRKYGKWILLSEHEYEKAKTWIKKHGVFVSFFSRLLPGVRTVVSLPAGVARIAIMPFVIWTFIGSLLWSYILVYAGYVLGSQWEQIEHVFKPFELVIIAIALLVVVWYVWKKVREGRAEVVAE
ncbi:MAG: DedA family protein [Candidatus Dojkabacteria bacterium]|nr:DedA family protein [Candidatus Dojkabacteria bacterium]